MTRANALTLIVGIIVGWFAVALFAGGLPAPAFVLALILAVAIWLLRVLNRPDMIYALIGVAAGIVVPLLVPQLSLDSIGADPLVQTLGLLIYVQQA
jgi:hypothetical protein